MKANRAKYKGRQLVNNEWVYGYYCMDLHRNIHDRSMPTIQTEERETHWVKLDTVCEYTGEKDKNDKDIYEGDIVMHEGEQGIIIFERASFVIEYENECVCYGGSWHIEELEVIGNINKGI